MTTVLERWDALVAHGELRPDADQRQAAERLTTLERALEAPRERGLLRRLRHRHPPSPRGVYLWGDVGRGKSMLMDAFFGTLDIAAKRRVHFHEFMLEVHDRLRDARRSGGRGGEGDPVLVVAAALAAEVRLLAFDELVVNNPADAMVMSRLFTAVMAAGTTLVATSNRPPADLYLDGLNRPLFLPFIRLIEGQMDVIALNGAHDYRRERLRGLATWHWPLGDAATAAVREAFFRLTDYPPEDALHVPAADLALPGGRVLHVPKSLKGVAVFSFRRLCGEPRGAADYLAVARRYHTVIVVGIPVLTPERRNEAARFVTLVDALYEHNVKLFAAAAAEPADLYPAGDGRFEFARTVSRLEEMRSADYLARGHGV